MVSEKVEWDSVVVRSWGGVICVASFSGVYNWSSTGGVFHCVETECCASSMFAEKHRMRFSINKSDHRVFPVSDMVSETYSSDSVAQVEGIEVEIKRVDYAGTFFDPEDGHGGGGEAIAMRRGGGGVGTGGGCVVGAG